MFVGHPIQRSDEPPQPLLASHQERPRPVPGRLNLRTTRPSIADSELFDGAAPKLKAPPAGALAPNVGAAPPDPNTKGDGAELRALGSAGGAIPEAPEPN